MKTPFKIAPRNKKAFVPGLTDQRRRPEIRFFSAVPLCLPPKRPLTASNNACPDNGGPAGTAYFQSFSLLLRGDLLPAPHCLTPTRQLSETGTRHSFPFDTFVCLVCICVYHTPPARLCQEFLRRAVPGSKPRDSIIYERACFPRKQPGRGISAACKQHRPHPRLRQVKTIPFLHAQSPPLVESLGKKYNKYTHKIR